jgi:type IX secretion system substrate protein
MKKLSNLKWQLAAALLGIVLNANHALAQCTNFIPAVVSELTTSPGNIAATSETGNDSKNSQLNASTMEVNVWAGANAGLGWDDGTHANFLSFASTTYDPDVSLVEGYSAGQAADTWYAIVVYGDASSNITCDFYEWDLTNFDFSTIGVIASTNLQSSAFYGYVNVDADASNNFVVVWDYWNSGAGQPEINTASGSSLPGSNPPQLCAGYPVTLNNSLGMWAPDVSLYPDPGNSTSVVHYVYLDASMSTIYVTYDDFATLCGGHSSNNAYYSDAPSHCNFDSPPRISAPPNTNGAATTDWSVVSTTRCNGIHDVVGYTSYYPPGNSYLPYKWKYTDNSINVNLCAVDPNRFPVVSYDGGNTGIMISWICEYSAVDRNHLAHPYFNDIAPIALALDPKGGLGGNAPSCYPNHRPWYMIVQSDNLSQPPVLGSSPLQEYTISISGRDYSDMQYTFFNSATTDIQYKNVTFCSANLSLRSAMSTDMGTTTVFSNPFSDELKINIDFDYALINIFDVTGKILISAAGTVPEINKQLNGFAKKLPSGVYIMKMDTGSGEAINQKLIKI